MFGAGSLGEGRGGLVGVLLGFFVVLVFKNYFGIKVLCNKISGETKGSGTSYETGL